LVEIALNFELQKNQFVSVYRDRKLTFLLDFFVAYNRTKFSPKCFKISICMDAFVSDFFEIYFLKLYEKKGSMVVLQGFSTYFFISNAIFDAMHVCMVCGYLYTPSLNYHGNHVALNLFSDFED
jgi:hypothetical protein